MWERLYMVLLLFEIRVDGFGYLNIVVLHQLVMQFCIMTSELHPEGHSSVAYSVFILRLRTHCGAGSRVIIERLWGELSGWSGQRVESSAWKWRLHTCWLYRLKKMLIDLGLLLWGFQGRIGSPQIDVFDERKLRKGESHVFKEACG